MASQLVVVCPHCKTRLRVPAGASGDRIRLRCRSCDQPFTVRLAAATGADTSAAGASVGLAPRGDTVAVTATPSGSSSGAMTAVPLTSTPGPSSPASAAYGLASPPLGVSVAPRSLPSADTGGPAEERQRQPVFAPGALVAERYEVVRFIARGGVGEVYEAQDRELHQRVALKTIRSDHDGGQVLDRFRREIQLARVVTHPNVCRIFDIGHHDVPEWAQRGGIDRITFLTMELLAGETLADRLRRDGPLTPEAARPLIEQMAAALGAAHRAGIIHRDFKCGNVVLCPAPSGGERAVVTDFGLARGLDRDVGLTVSNPGDIVGTPAYMAPEQLESEPVSPATDVYALGIVLYEMLTGKLPFIGDTALSTAVKRLTEAPTPPHVHLPDIDRRYEVTILRCLERDPARRFQATEEVLASLDAAPTQPERAVELTQDLRSADRAAIGGDQRPAFAASPTSGGPQAPAEAVAGRPPSVRRRRYERSLLGALLLVLVVAGVLEARKRVPWVGRLLGGPAGPRPAVAVLGFRNSSEDPQRAWLSTALAEMLSSELAAGRRVRTVSGEAVARARHDLDLGAVDSLGLDTLGKLRVNLGADYVVLGSYVVLGDTANSQLRVDLKLQDTRDGDTTALTDNGSISDLFTLVGNIGSGLRKELGQGRAAVAARSALPRNAEAARFYAEGVDRLHDFDPLGARDLLEKAAQLEPDNPLVRSALAAAWSSLGYATKAQEQARLAASHAAELPEEERLAVDGRLQESLQEWGAATETYRRLVALEPDNLEYGLRLARVLTSGGAAGEAITVLDGLRTLPEPASSDPHIDLAEATAAAVLGSYERQRDAAARAAQLGVERGARLLVADARVSLCWALRNLAQTAEARAACEQAHELYLEVGNLAGAAAAATSLAGVLFDQGDVTAARRLYEEALATYRERGDQGGLAVVNNNLAVLLRRSGDLAGARSLYEQTIAISREIGNRFGEAHGLNNLGGVLLERGELTAARAIYEQALAIRRETGDRGGTASSLHSLASVDRKRGELAVARRGYEEALTLHRESGQRVGEMSSLVGLGRVLLDGGDVPGALREGTTALELAAAAGNRGAEASALTLLADAAFAAGELSVAIERHTRAASLREELGERTNAAENRLGLASAAIERGDFAGAVAQAQEAAQVYGRDQLRDGEGLARITEARAELGRGENEVARQVAEAAQALLESSENRLATLQLATVVARVTAAAGRAGEAVVALRGVAEDAEAAGYHGVALEARLFLGRMELARGNVAVGRGELERVAREGNASGLGLLERKAEGFLG